MKEKAWSRLHRQRRGCAPINSRDNKQHKHNSYPLTDVSTHTTWIHTQTHTTTTTQQRKENKTPHTHTHTQIDTEIETTHTNPRIFPPTHMHTRTDRYTFYNPSESGIPAH